MNLVFAQTLAIALLAGADEIGAAMKESEIIEELESNEAQVFNEKGGLAVYRAWSERRIELAARLDRMVYLHASWCRGQQELHGPELRHLKGHRRLRKLDIYRMPISGEYLDVLPTLPKLEELHCIPKERIKEALVHIGNCKNLRLLSFEWGHIPDDCLGPLARLTKLEELHLSDSPVSSGVQVVKHMTRMKYLNLEETLVGDDELKVIAGLEHLETLFVRSPNITDAGVGHLAGCARIETLSADSPQVTPNGLKQLARLPRLRTLYLWERPINAATLESLKTIETLEKLVGNGKGISRAARKKLEGELPQCEFVWMGDPDARPGRFGSNE
jgi:hypothetical protein